MTVLSHFLILYMKKISIALVFSILFVAQGTFAQSYFPSPLNNSHIYNGSCVSLSRDLSIGSRGTDVLNLQRFILSRNYLGSGTWMLTGRFGAATRAGVIDFQIDMHMPQTGWVDASTRAAVSSITCGNSFNQNNQYQYGYNSYVNQQPWLNNSWNNNTWNSNFWNNSGNNNSWNNNFPPVINQPLPTGNGNCSNAYGVSTCQCGWYSVAGRSYYNECGSNYNQNNLSITYLSPNSGATGSTVTITGTGFSSTNNSVRFGNGSIAGLNSYDGRTLTFTVPATLSGYGSANVTQGTYNVSVTNASGATSNSVPFSITSGGNYGAPSIHNISGPNTIAVNSTGTWIISLLNQNNSNYTNVSVKWGDPVYGAYAVGPQRSYNNQPLSFTHSYTQLGTYTITFTATSENGQSNTATQTVYVTNSNNNNNNNFIISNITPATGRVGSQIQIEGSGFTGDNTVHFGQPGQANGSQMHLTSASGNYINYTIPSYIYPCDLQTQSTVCTQYMHVVNPGAYQIYVTNSSGTSNTLTFNVQ